MSSRSLDDLSDRMRPLAIELIERAEASGIHVRIIETRRTQEEQEAYIRRGVSWTHHSKHIEGDAIDLAPVAVLALKNWAPNDPAWEQLGEIGEEVGLFWGGRWKVRDMPHFEFINGEKRGSA